MRKITLAFSLALLCLSAGRGFAQAPPAVAALPDAERRTSYSLSGSTCACSVGFQLYGDSTDVDAWIEVFIDGTRYPSTDLAHGWALSSTTGSLASIPRPITNAVLTFNQVQTGTVQIVGSRRPRRTSQFQENRGVAARDLNQALTDIVATQRETWDRTNDVTGRAYLAPPGQLGTVLSGALNGVLSGPATTTDKAIVRWNGGTGIALQNSIPTISDNGTLTLAPAPNSLASAFNVTQAVAGTQVTPTLQLNNIAISDGANLTLGNGVNVDYVYGGGASQGSRQALQVGMTLSAPTNVANTHHFYVGFAVNAQANTGDGGTNTGAGALGSIIGSNPNATAGASATNLAELSGEEIIVQALAGSSMKGRMGLSITDASGAGGARGAVFDQAISLGNNTNSPGWLCGICLDGSNYGSPPVATTGTAIATVGTQTMANFIDISSSTISGSFIKGPGSSFVVSGAGHITTVGDINMGASNILSWNGRAAEKSPADGIITLSNNAGTDFVRLQLGGATASFPSIKRNATAVNFRLADDSADAPIAALSGSFSGGTASTSTATGTILVTGGGGFTGAIYGGGEIVTGKTVVGSLPTCDAAHEGARHYVTDQNTAVSYRGAVTGSGSTHQAVLCNGTSWLQD